MRPHLLGDPNSGHTHTGANAHAGDANLLVGPVELGQKCAHLAGASAAERVTEGDSTTLGVDLLLGQAKLIDTPHTLGGECLIDLVDVDIILGDAGFLKGNGNGLPGANTHEQGLDADNACGNVLSDDFLAQRSAVERFMSRTAAAPSEI